MISDSLDNYPGVRSDEGESHHGTADSECSLRNSLDNAKSEQDASCEEHKSEENEVAGKWRLKMSNNLDDVKCDQQSEGEHEFEEIETVSLWK